MAEIRVERAPRRRMGWLWLVVIVLLIAVAWYLWANGVVGAKTTTAPDTTRTGLVGRPAAVTALLDVGAPLVARATVGIA
ncbi:MAG: hypothetical protein HOQ31_13890 [Gemmatimonadaceae bacterium]|nr:hypothetical protein [Gemmatimonadaceae bacterium]NUP71463.1 hypothetical protein [Gemmatimonadaceae bacterium]NUR35303.1 hypothetical protein [Gemmatimonadaceae bacterium]